MPSGLPTLVPDVELIIAAGMLEGAGDLNDQLTVEAATERLRELLSPAALWWSGPLPPSGPAELTRCWLGNVPRWRSPAPALRDKLAITLRIAWTAALPPSTPGWGPPVLRLEVSDAASAQQLAALGEVGPYQIVPHIRRQRRTGFSWRWPMRIGIAQGPRSDQWRHELESSQYASLYDVRALGPDNPEPVDIAFVDADAASIKHAATCVVVLGESTSPAERLVRGRDEEPEAAIVIGGESSDVKWFEGAIREMAHDQPIDVALRIASPASLIAADPHWLPLTAIRQWSLEFAEQLHEQEESVNFGVYSTDADDLRNIVRTELFDAEPHGAMRVARAVQAFERLGYETTLSPRPMAMAGPTEEAAQPVGPAAVVTPARRLIADAYAGKRVRRKTLFPDSDHELLVKVAIPRKGETAAQVDLPEHALPANESVELMVDVTSAALGLRARQPIVLSTADCSAPSTTAVFVFHTPGEGAVVDIKILVTYQERPLQEAHYVASVRSRPINGDRARLTAVALSSSPEPLANATPAQVSLEVNGANLERTDSGDVIDLSHVRGILDAIESESSRVLASDEAPEALADPASVQLLVKLARAGTMLKRFLEPLRIGDAATISLLVDASSEVLPLELVYDAPNPVEGAQLCEHRPGGAMAGKPGICSNAGESVVCPRAFWGQRRVIARTIRLRGKPARRSLPTPLNLRPVLYAAAARADADAPTNKKPSDLLQAQLTGMVGEPALARVSNWSKWKREVQQRRPQLLVVLGHTESAGIETRLEIGSKSWLSTPDINLAHLHHKDAPPPLVVLLACSTAVSRDYFGGLPAAFTGSGAAAVVATLTKLHGPQGASAAAAVVRSLCDGGRTGSASLGAALTAARRQLIEEGLLVGLLLVAHGEIDLPLTS